MENLLNTRDQPEVHLGQPEVHLLPLPEGYRSTSVGLVVPEGDDGPEGLIIPGISDLPPDLRVSPDGPESYQEELFLWLDPVAGLNRTIANEGLSHLFDTFGHLQRYSEGEPGARDAVLETLRTIRSPEEIEQLHEDFHVLADKLVELLPDQALDSPALWSSLTHIADVISINTDMADIPQSQGLHELMLRALNRPKPPREALDLTSRLELTNDTVDALLDGLGNHPNHPLYWIAGDLRPDHPTVQKQRNLVSRLQKADDFKNELISISMAGDIGELIRLLPLGSLVDEHTWPRSGLELETTVFGGVAKVPTGTKMGTDVASGNTKILELQLDDKTDPTVLNYDAGWRQRYFEVWRWSQVARSVDTSIHLHSEGTLKYPLAQKVFGSDENDCRANSLGTVEVRTALSGYEGGGQGYDDMPPLALLELLHTLDTPALAMLSDLRLRDTEYASRLSTENISVYSEEVSVAKALESDDRHILQLLVGDIASLEGEMREKVEAKALASDDSYILGLLVGNIASLEGETREKVEAKALASDDSYILRLLVGDLASLEGETREKVEAKALASER
jgi:hypothetical protein